MMYLLRALRRGKRPHKGTLPWEADVGFPVVDGDELLTKDEGVRALLAELVGIGKQIVAGLDRLAQSKQE